MGRDETLENPLEGEIPRSRDEQGERESEEVREKAGDADLDDDAARGAC